ncbi:hypothetical protein N7489_008589 [Penicillium chrysogenum]|uniref:uncharacterized protein n=1 Tax=Penicillium chrysogenum TaxID=5076 RepID=UPI0024DF0F48|nr:uncharacterized protein N7489_008589 [Penicillium chrysogenum]KAJ5227881.1 hypothetical protein N7489_008589 [Penicillium chrysogenum]
MKVTIGNVLAATLALTYPVQARNSPLNGRDPVPAINEADSFQENATPHKGVVIQHIWIPDEASMTATSSAHLNPIHRHPKPSTQLPMPSVAPNGGNTPNHPSATAKEGDQGTESAGSPNSSSVQSNPSEIPSHSSNAPEPPVIPNSRSDSLIPSGIPSGIPSHPSNIPEPSVIPNSRSDSLIPSGIPSHPSNMPQPSVIPSSRSDTPSPSGAPHPNQPDSSEAPTPRSSEPASSKLGESSKTNTPPTSSQEGTGSDSATPSKVPQQTGSASATPFASSNPDSTIESSMMAVTTSGHTTTEAIPVPVTTVKITKGQETSSITFTATSVTTSDGSEPTFAWGCASSDLCGSGTTDSGGGSSGCVVPLLCPSDHNWGLGGGWSPSGNPSPGGPNPPPSTPKTPSGSGSESPDDNPEDEDDKTTTSTSATDKTTSSTTSTASSTSSPSPSKLRLCMTVAESGTVKSTSTPTSSSKASTSATSTPTSASKIRLCMSVAESGSVIATSEAASTTDRKSNTITSAPRTFSTSTKDPLCRDRQDPHGPNSCICTSGASEILLPVREDGRCGYTTLPATPTPTETATTEAQPAPTLGPVTSTTNDEMIIWPTQTIKYYNVPGTKLTETYPAGEPTTSTMTADTPEATEWSPKGSSICGTKIGDGLSPACKAAWEKYDDDTVYTKKTKRHDSNALGMGCTAEYSCSEDSDYTPGLNGAQLKELFSSLYDTEGNGITICGSAKLSNGCSVKVDYCSLCKDAN